MPGDRVIGLSSAFQVNGPMWPCGHVASDASPAGDSMGQGGETPAARSGCRPPRASYKSPRPGP